MGKVLVLANSASGLYDFRNELILELMKSNEVHIGLPDADKVPQLETQGCIIHYTPVDRRGINPVKDLKLMSVYKRIINDVRPSVVLTYTIKPNIYGGLSCKALRVPYIANITGLGSAFEKGGAIKLVVVNLYKLALKKASCVFFQNSKNRKVFADCGIKSKKTRLVPGSGVNLSRHFYEEYPSEENGINLVYVGRIMKEKGTDELLYTIEKIKEEYPAVRFTIVGNYEDNYKEIVEDMERRGLVTLAGYQLEIHPYYKDASAVLMPSYHEGMSNVILEASASGRPVLATNISGCMEGFEHEVTGIGFEPRSSEAMYNAVKQFVEMPWEKRMAMGRCARDKMEREFDRKKVVDAYMEEINIITK